MIDFSRAYDRRHALKQRTLFYSPGLTLPFIAAVAALIVMWTLYAANIRLVDTESNAIYFGSFTGLLSGVVLFAIMRAFDRNQNKRRTEDLVTLGEVIYGTIKQGKPPQFITTKIAIDNLRRICAANLAFRPDILADHFLCTGYFFNSKMPNRPKIYSAKRQLYT